MKKVKSFNETIAVYFDAEWDVYKVVVKDRPEATAEEDDKQAAFDTAEAMVKHMAEAPEAYEPSPLNEGALDREGEWEIGYVNTHQSEEKTTLWFGHYTTDEDMGCGQIIVVEGEVVDYDGVYELRPEVYEMLTRQGFDVSFLA